MDDNIAIVVENVSKVFQLHHSKVDENGNVIKEHWALKDVSFEIKKGESIGIIGSNGSGKSTLLKILAGITKPTSGHVRIKGKVASILDIGAGFHPELSGRENVFLNGQIHGFSKNEITTKFDEIILFSGIEKFIDEPVKNYSNGMYLRLAFSIMAHLDFDVYLLDEILSVGDIEFQNKCVTRILELSKEEKTLIVVYHSLPFVDRMITREINLKKINNIENSGIVTAIDILPYDLEVVMESGNIDYFYFPHSIFKLNPRITKILIAVKSSLGTHIATTSVLDVGELFELEKDDVKIKFNLKLTSGIYFFDLFGIIDGGYSLLYSIRIQVLQNESSLKEYEVYGEKMNSTVLFESQISLT